MIQWRIVLLDITEKKNATAALERSESKHRNMMASITDGVYVCSPERTIEYMNPGMIKRLDRDATGEICYKAMHGLNEGCEWCPYERVVNGETVEQNIESPLDNRTYRITHMPVLNDDQTISKMAMYRDITDYLSAVKEKEKAQAQKMESIGTLAGGIAHDFNNILTPIVGYAEMLLYDTPEESLHRDSLDEIYQSSMRVKRLVQQILTFSRQEKGKLKPMKMQPVIKEVLKLIRSTIPTTIEINQDIQPDCGIIKGDPTQVHQIVLNLTANAFHAMEEKGGELKVTLKQVALKEPGLIHSDLNPGEYACLTISDTGRGMDKELTQKIFDPFFTTKEVGKGTGLSTVHGIVAEMNGAIHVESEPDRGSQFHVYLPVTEEVKFENLPSQDETAIQGGSEHILLVDDEALIIKLEQKMLENLGYKVTSFSGSLEALKAFQAAPDKFDLIITDMAMPNMAGDKLAVELIKIRSDIPILLCTGFSETMSEKKAVSLGIKGFLLKPIIMEDLAPKIREVLDK